MEFTELFAVILSLLIPIVAIICGSIISIRKKKSETELRRMIIENGTDLETAKVLVEPKEQKSDKNSTLRMACVLIGMGVGAFANFFFGLKPDNNIYFWFVIAFGIGLGLLVSFFIELKLQDKKTEKQQ